MRRFTIHIKLYSPDFEGVRAIDRLDILWIGSWQGDDGRCSEPESDATTEGEQNLKCEMQDLETYIYSVARLFQRHLGDSEVVRRSLPGLAHLVQRGERAEPNVGHFHSVVLKF